MGQEAGKAAWPKPSGGYQTVTGRRYGRRHAYISFRPSLESPNRASVQQKKESEGLELGSVQKENDLTSRESHDSSLLDIGSVVTAAFQDSRTLDSNNTLSLFSESFKPSLPSFPMLEDTRGCQSLNNSNDCKEGNKTFLMHTPVEHPPPSHQSGNSFVNIDSFEPDSSEGEENVGLCEDFSLKSESWRNMQLVNKALDKLQREVLSECSTINHSYAEESICQGIASISKYSNLDLYTAPWSLSASSVSEDEAIGISSAELCEFQQKNTRPDLISKTEMCSETNAGHAKTDPTSEPVVRPKIRKPHPSVSSGKISLVTDENGKEAKNSRTDKRERQARLPKSFKAEELPITKETESGHAEGSRRKLKGASKDNPPVKEDKPLVDDTFWDDFEVYGLKMMDPGKDEDSSECSDGEWSTCLPSYFSGDKDHSSSDESWETLPGKEEHEVRSNSSSLEEENSDFCFQVEEQNSLEDGEIPWLQYQEDIESSTDEENEIGNHYLPPGFFILDGNNNLEDDSSMSEDLEVEWRLLDDFGDGIGVAQAMSYMDPQFLTYMALEERLAQAMETALAHLESLAVDMEQAHPPATKESIDCLPQIVLTDDHIIVGQEQCCAICCSEYIKDEVLTELPCHHLFHKPCVTLWLQKSGTCPVCRHVLTSVLPEAAAATSFLSDHDSPPSIHNAAGTR
ncbi:E3 ubiquitin-protein ligase Praja-2 [Hyperolius riggenbachi]|uniref:E3 ubiquitin-protein ligase Praja-2 n=1 Tax=Hyperolius riggenbachi TaxID=752182 RepID=UPI0035A3893A